MPIVVKLKQQMADGHKCQGQYFAKRVNTGTLDIDDLAQMVQDNVSVKKSDVKAVIEEFIDVMKRQMQTATPASSTASARSTSPPAPSTPRWRSSRAARNA